MMCGTSKWSSSSAKQQTNFYASVHQIEKRSNWAFLLGKRKFDRRDSQQASSVLCLSKLRKYLNTPISNRTVLLCTFPIWCVSTWTKRTTSIGWGELGPFMGSSITRLDALRKLSTSISERYCISWASQHNFRDEDENHTESCMNWQKYFEKSLQAQGKSYILFIERSSHFQDILKRKVLLLLHALCIIEHHKRLKTFRIIILDFSWLLPTLCIFQI